MPNITIQSQVINFPDSGTSPNWASSVTQFAQAVEDALSSVVGPFDVGSQIQIIDASNPGTNVNLTNLNFPISTVRGAFIRYSVSRTTNSTSAFESGNLMVVYNPDGSIGSKWEMVRDYVGDGQITFNITDTGQVQFSTTALAGINHEGRISFVAQALLQSE